MADLYDVNFDRMPSLNGYSLNHVHNAILEFGRYRGDEGGIDARMVNAQFEVIAGIARFLEVLPLKR